MIAKAVRTTGELLITLGLVLLLFVGYELWGTGVQTARAQNAADDRLEQVWATGGVLPGEAEPAGEPSGSGPSA
ncbi:MAG: class E sortase, partial [Mycobacteriales bacterium]